MVADMIDVKLAISLHAPNQELREKIMPIARTFKLNDLMRSIDEYVKATKNRIFYEYIMIKDVTDKPELAKQLCHLLRGRLAHVNLIPYNANPAIKLGESSIEKVREFQKILESFGITTTVRDSMGRSVKSACGQLGFEKVSKTQDDNSLDIDDDYIGPR
jgi:23S rRNA (adenine2503-C2)-methyltransferase